MSPATPPIRWGEIAKEEKQAASSYREECWSAEETEALMEAWGSVHLSLKRGSLRQQQWSYVSAAVNESNEQHERRQRTDAQCKNRMDTLKKKFKMEKAKVKGDGDYVSAWPLYSRLEYLIGGGEGETETPSVLGRFPVKRRSALPKRPARWLREDKESEEGESVNSGGGRKERSERDDDDDEKGGWSTLAGAIRRLGEVYQRVESMKQEKVIELEMHRMQFTKDLEYQRIRLLMDTHLQLLSRFKRPKLHHHFRT